MKKYKIISLIALIVLLAIGGFVLGFFFACLRRGISVGSIDVAGEVTNIPLGTSSLLICVYVLVAIATVIAVIGICKILSVLFKTHPGRAWAILSVIVSVPISFTICYLLASPEPVSILGYMTVEGFAPRLSEACLYETYLYVFVAFVVLVWGVINFIKNSASRIVK